MANQNGYSIFVGTEQPRFFQKVQNVDKEGLPFGDAMEVPVGVGTHQISNMCAVWGRRIARDETTKKDLELSGVEFTDERYKGEIEFLPYQDEKGQSITLRYIKSQRSLDAQYQENVLNVNTKDMSPFIDLRAGQNDFDYKKDKLLIEFLKVHPDNQSSVSKNTDPSIKKHVFYELKNEDVSTKEIEHLELRNTLQGNINKWCTEADGVTKVLLKMLLDNGAKISVTSISPELQILKALLSFAENNSIKFDALIKEHKQDIVFLLEKAKEKRVIEIGSKHDIKLVHNINDKVSIFDGKALKFEEIADKFYLPTINKELEEIDNVLDKIKK
jgi:hypothetical protein